MPSQLSPAPFGETSAIATARAALRRAELELAAGCWHMYPSGVEAAQQILRPLDALARLTPEQRGSGAGQPEALMREALGEIATAALRTEGGLRQLVAAVCAALDPLVQPHPALPCGTVPTVADDAARLAAAEQILEPLQRLLRTALAQHGGIDEAQGRPLP
ncbi:hypothetical protein [Streptacidiphilus rugosus]|uniref:hypothetical protein n=1 Tax=Streptacidiphilus rugosus TaxID=405783 RepID=UPI000567EBBF|nr:hypothetical protein [Streptacidiphilus rugosus]